jgi:hypothetical protein
MYVGLRIRWILNGACGLDEFGSLLGVVERFHDRSDEPSCFTKLVKFRYKLSDLQHLTALDPVVWLDCFMSGPLYFK